MKRLGKKKKEFTRTYTVSSDYQDFLDELEKVLRTIEYLSSVGSSREVSIYVDGDGRCDLQFEREGENGSPVEMVENDKDTDKDKITFSMC
jgi:hypothetical protein